MSFGLSLPGSDSTSFSSSLLTSSTSGKDVYIAGVLSQQGDPRFGFSTTETDMFCDGYTERFNNGQYIGFYDNHEVDKDPIGEILMLYRNGVGNLCCVGHISGDTPGGKAAIHNANIQFANGLSAGLSTFGSDDRTKTIPEFVPKYRQLKEASLTEDPAFKGTTHIKYISNDIKHILEQIAGLQHDPDGLDTQVARLPRQLQSLPEVFSEQYKKGREFSTQPNHLLAPQYKDPKNWPKKHSKDVTMASSFFSALTQYENQKQKNGHRMDLSAFFTEKPKVFSHGGFDLPKKVIRTRYSNKSPIFLGTLREEEVKGFIDSIVSLSPENLFQIKPELLSLVYYESQASIPAMSGTAQPPAQPESTNANAGQQQQPQQGTPAAGSNTQPNTSSAQPPAGGAAVQQPPAGTKSDDAKPEIKPGSVVLPELSKLPNGLSVPVTPDKPDGQQSTDANKAAPAATTGKPALSKKEIIEAFERMEGEDLVTMATMFEVGKSQGITSNDKIAEHFGQFKQLQQIVVAKQAEAEAEKARLAKIEAENAIKASNSIKANTTKMMLAPYLTAGVVPQEHHEYITKILNSGTTADYTVTDGDLAKMTEIATNANRSLADQASLQRKHNTVKKLNEEISAGSNAILNAIKDYKDPYLSGMLGGSGSQQQNPQTPSGQSSGGSPQTPQSAGSSQSSASNATPASASQQGGNNNNNNGKPADSQNFRIQEQSPLNDETGMKEIMSIASKGVPNLADVSPSNLIKLVTGPFANLTCLSDMSKYHSSFCYNPDGFALSGYNAKEVDATQLPFRS